MYIVSFVPHKLYLVRYKIICLIHYITTTIDSFNLSKKYEECNRVYCAVKFSIFLFFFKIKTIIKTPLFAQISLSAQQV